MDPELSLSISDMALPCDRAPASLSRHCDSANPVNGCSGFQLLDQTLAYTELAVKQNL